METSLLRLYGSSIVDDLFDLLYLLVEIYIEKRQELVEIIIDVIQSVHTLQ